MLNLNKMSFWELEEYLVAAYYACDHVLSSEIMREMENRPEYDQLIEEESLD